MVAKISDEQKYEELRKELIMRGNDCVQEFLGFSDDISGLSKDEIENLMDDTYEQMPDDVLEEMYEKFIIRNNKKSKKKTQKKPL